MGAALDGIRVLDLSSRAAGAWCTRLLADFGADVVMVEPPDGHALRAMGPFADDGRSAVAAYLLANKRSVLLPPSATDDLQHMISWAQVLVDDALPGDALDYAHVSRINPGLIVCSVTPFGQDGMRSRRPGNDLIISALSGWASINGLQEQAPLKSSGLQTSYQAGSMAYGSIVCALLARRATGGAGQHIDVAELEVACSTFAPALLRSLLQGQAMRRRQVQDLTNGPVPVKDGYFALTLTRPHFWRHAMQLLDLPDLADDEMLQKTWYRRQHKERFVDRVQDNMRHWTRRDLFDGLAQRRVIAGPVLNMAELGDNEQLRERGFFGRPAQVPDGPLYPGAPCKLSVSPWRLQQGMPDLGEHSEVVRQEIGRHGPPVSVPHDGKTPALIGPLTGYRGLVLTQAWAGTYATELLGFMGAEIIQLEVHKRLDSWRGTPDSPMPDGLRSAASAVHPWNCNPSFNSVNLNKQSITLDLATSEGIAVFKALLPQADFVAENFSPRVMGKLGIDYDVLRQIKPNIILCSLSGYGQTGPWANVPAIGGTIEPTSGMSDLLGYEDGIPLNSGLMYPDAVAGIYGFATLATALYHRQQTGQGQYLDLSMQEANATFVGDAWLAYALTGQVRERMGNRHPLFAPHGIYPCAGDDQWMALAVEDDPQWQRLCQLAKHSAWQDEPRFQTMASRKQHEALLDQTLAEWTRSQFKHELAERLGAAGLLAAPVLDGLEVATDRGLIARGHLVPVAHPETGVHMQSGVPVRMSRTPPQVSCHAPLLGQHSFAVFERLLGMTGDTYEELVAKGITGTEPPQ
jgi:crotonobetainyl-CoA:carnitine CoA-transferase CaiB-like acyl-CoA transferase